MSSWQYLTSARKWARNKVSRSHFGTHNASSIKGNFTSDKAKAYISIHGAHPELFSRFMNDLKSKITIVEKRENTLFNGKQKVFLT